MVFIPLLPLFSFVEFCVKCSNKTSFYKKKGCYLMENCQKVEKNKVEKIFRYRNQ